MHRAFGEEELKIAREIVVIGGGITGLTCGWHLLKAGHKVKILEREDIVGGLARSFLVDGKWVPLSYHHVMLPDKNTLSYIKLFGFSTELRWTRSPQVLWYDYRCYTITPWNILFFKPLDPISRLRMLYLGAYVWARKDWDDLRNMDCAEWLNKVAGKNNTEIIFDKLMAIKFNMPLSSVSAAWLGKRMHQSVRNKDMYGYIDSGWQGLLNKMSEEIAAMGGEILTGFDVSNMTDRTVTGKGPNRQRASLPYDLAVSTIPPPALYSILDLPDRVKAPLGAIKYKSIISFVCASKEVLSSNYWSVVLKPHLIFGGFFNFSVVSGIRDMNGDAIYYFFTYMENDDPLLAYEDAKLKEIYVNDIRKIFPGFSLSWYKVFRLRDSQPVFRKNYENLPIGLTENIYLSGVYRQYPQPRTMDAAFAGGHETAKYIIDKYGKN